MITRTEITGAQKRLRALPRHFGKSAPQVENAVYNFARGLCHEYSGGYWKFYELNNGGFYMVPEIDEPVRVQWGDNYYRGTMTADAFGIVVCLFALSHLSFGTGDAKGAENIAEHFHWLRVYAMTHAEAREIFAAID